MNADPLGHKQFTFVEACEVPTRNGIRRIDAFHVSVYPVTIAEFREFCNATRYVTEAEQNASPITYGRNPELQTIAAEAGVQVYDLSVHMVSWNDACWFCKWANAALPSDAEWLAASIVDWETVYPNATVGYRANFQRARLRDHGDEWTSSLASETNPAESVFELGGYKRIDANPTPRADDVTVRYGPVYARFEGWEKKSFTMRAPHNFYSDRIGFRVIRR